MKVYIVTSGCYSDYSIDRVFKSKEKAQKYIDLKYKEDKYNQEPSIEEYDIFNDKKLIREFEYYYVCYTKYKDSSLEDIRFLKQKSINLDFYQHNIGLIDRYADANGNYQYSNDIGIYHPIRTLSCYINPRKNVKDLRKHFLQICRDYMAELESLIEIEGWNNDMIEKHVKSKFKLS